MNLNKVFLIGNVTRDPEIKSLPSGQTVASFSVATNRFFTDKNGQRQQRAEFHNVIAWGRLADVVSKFLKRGSLVLVEGRLQTRSWQDQTGTTRYRTEVIAERLNLGPKGGRALVETEKEHLEEINLDNLSEDKEIDLSQIPY